MKALLLIMVFPLCSIAQHYLPNEKLPFKARVISDSGTINGYFIAATDSSVIISHNKRYAEKAIMNIPVSSISKLQVKSKSEFTVLAVAGGTILGFILAAGLIQNDTDTNKDGNTSFWELLFAAIDGTTSSDRGRRTTALIAGGVGGTLFLAAGLFSLKKVSISFPINGRGLFFKGKRETLDKYTNF